MRRSCVYIFFVLGASSVFQLSFSKYSLFPCSSFWFLFYLAHSHLPTLFLCNNSERMCLLEPSLADLPYFPSVICTLFCFAASFHCLLFFLFFHSIFHFPFLWISVLHLLSLKFAGHAGPHFKLRFVFLLMRIFSFFFTKQSTRSQMKRFSFFSPPFLLDIFSSSHLLAEHEHKSPSSTPLHEHEHIRVLPTNQLTIKIVASHILIIPAPFLGSFLHEDDPNHLEEEKNTQKERKSSPSPSPPARGRSTVLPRPSRSSAENNCRCLLWPQHFGRTFFLFSFFPFFLFSFFPFSLSLSLSLSLSFLPFLLFLSFLSFTPAPGLSFSCLDYCITLSHSSGCFLLFLSFLACFSLSKSKNCRPLHLANQQPCFSMQVSFPKLFFVFCFFFLTIFVHL